MTDIIKNVYDSLQGLLTEEAAVPWVQDAFGPGSYCERQYASAWAAYERLCVRLGVDPDDEDEDLFGMIDALESIQKELCRKMFICGEKYAHMK